MGDHLSWEVSFEGFTLVVEHLVELIEVPGGKQSACYRIYLAQRGLSVYEAYVLCVKG